MSAQPTSPITAKYGAFEPTSIHRHHHDPISEERATAYADSLEPVPASTGVSANNDQGASSDSKTPATMADVYKGFTNLVMDGIGRQESNYREQIKERSWNQNS